MIDLDDLPTPDDPICAWCSAPSLGTWVTFATHAGLVEHWKQRHQGKVASGAMVAGEECSMADIEGFVRQCEGRETDESLHTDEP